MAGAQWTPESNQVVTQIPKGKRQPVQQADVRCSENEKGKKDEGRRGWQKGIGHVLFVFILDRIDCVVGWRGSGEGGQDTRQASRQTPATPTTVQRSQTQYRRGDCSLMYNVEILTRLGFALCWYSLGKPSSPVSTAVYVESMALSSSRKRNPAALVWSMLS